MSILNCGKLREWYVEFFFMNRNQAMAIGLIAVIGGSALLIAVWYPTTIPDVRIGYLSKDLHQLALRVALDNGWFEEAGIRISLVTFQNGALEMDGFLGNQIDMGYLGAAPALTKRINQDILITVLAAANLEGSAIMVRKADYDSGDITHIANLTGKGVYQPGSSTVQNFLLRLALDQAGMTFTDLSGTHTTSPAYMASSLTEEIPAFVAWEPFNAKAEYDGLAEPLLLSGDIWPRHPCCVLAASSDFMEQRPDIVQKVVEIHKRAQEWIVTHTTEAIAIAVDWLEMDFEPVETAFNRIIYDYNVNRTGLEIYLAFLVDQSLLDESKIPSDIPAFIDSFVNTTYIEES
ncbi:MAG: ABC transporter substrate-binding protein [Candidatus Thorarchaeota archaeon]|nr:ABC transporter substrate-binding protein [Candidatus Thorarchaeota archaeon]